MLYDPENVNANKKDSDRTVRMGSLILRLLFSHMSESTFTRVDTRIMNKVTELSC